MIGKKENRRYSRQIAIEDFGKQGQEKLLHSKVFIVGCGALGSMVAMQLAGAGVGHLGIADFDTIDISNLQRQFYFHTEETGKKKSEILKQRILELNPEVEVEEISGMITRKRAEELFKNYDFIIDATDNPESKRITGEVSGALRKGCCIGGVREYGGQVMTFQPEDARFEEYFGTADAEGFLPCSLGGVMGPAAALCASIQTIEAIKYLTGVGETLTGRLLIFNLKTNEFLTLSL